ncbi:MAG: chemotaxis protein CheD [Lachnospiraceae bacterium]|jgi:chemotaxis protein CheD|nr:chemotaxis protein CheD [Lachnospiraceae bacterium]
MEEEGKVIKIGMADLNVCTVPDKITTLGLGSCVGVVLYDRTKKICGMVHVMLPDSTMVKGVNNRAKFADTGIDYLLEMLEKKGVYKTSLSAKIAGGAKMFAFSSDNDMLNVGQRNVDAVVKKLKSLNIRIVAQDTGLNYGRTIIFDPADCGLTIKAVGKGIKVI